MRDMKSSSTKDATNTQFRRTALSVAVASALVGAGQVYAQAPVLEEIIVSGYRKSLEDAMSYKRNSDGVVDAINAEDIGKFPATNLAEALQRIPGVSINRVNGEGSLISVRGFGPDFNQITLNGRTMPTADIPEIGSGTDNQGVSGDGRAFDFSNLASDGVQTLEVYKTGRADVASGGIGATINVVTRKPLDNPGTSAVISAKAIADTTVDTGSSMTPELGGSYSWTNDDGNFGIGLFGSFAERNSAAASATSASWNVVESDEFPLTGTTSVTNAPADGDALVSLPRDSRYHFSEFESERVNGQLVVQFAPSDAVRMTADYTFASNSNTETRSDVSNWFAQTFSDVVFDDSPVQTAVLLREDTTNHGAAMQQTTRATKDELDSFGFNVEFDVSDNLMLAFDAHSSSAEVTPDIDGEYSRVNVGLDMKYTPDATTLNNSVDYSGDVPVMLVHIDTTPATAGMTNEELADYTVDTARAGTQVANLRSISQENNVDQFDLRGQWQLDDTASLTFGANYKTQDNTSITTDYRQILGNWGAENPGDVEALLGAGALEEFCISCRFDDYSIGGASLSANTVNPVVHSVRGDAVAIFNAASAAYGDADGFDDVAGSADDGRTLAVQTSNFDEIEETTLALYAQFDTEFDVADRLARLKVGLRYEDTDVTSISSSLPTERIDWQGNNDFSTFAATSADGTTEEYSYSYLLPNMDLAVDVTDDLVLRTSYSKTLARPTYNNLFAGASITAPPGATYFSGNQATAGSGNPSLLPLESDNFDLSVEWYFDESSYVSLGYFDKRVRNFVGTETVTENLFGLTDVSSGEAGTRSGDAVALLEELGVDVNSDNLFAMTVYVDTNASLDDARDAFVANQGPDGNIDDAVYLDLETNFDVSPNADDPLMEIAVNKPVNNREADIDGWELQGQHFFGDTGFGISGSLTVVNGDVEFDVAGDPTDSQFALAGLSDTANLTLMYEKSGWSARLSYNWRDTFLLSANDGSGFNNPMFVDEYTQIDVSVGYEVSDNLSITFEGINLNEESSRVYARSEEDMLFARENGARYYLGASYKF